MLLPQKFNFIDAGAYIFQPGLLQGFHQRFCGNLRILLFVQHQGIRQAQTLEGDVYIFTGFGVHCQHIHHAAAFLHQLCIVLPQHSGGKPVLLRDFLVRVEIPVASKGAADAHRVIPIGIFRLNTRRKPTIGKCCQRSVIRAAGSPFAVCCQGEAQSHCQCQQHRNRFLHKILLFISTR